MRTVRLTIIDDAYKGELLRNELSLMRSIGHTNLIKKIKVYQEDNNYFVMQEHGPILKNQIFPHLHKFSEIKVAVITKQLLEALAYLYDMNVVNRAVKSRNVILKHPLHFYGDTQVDVKLGDEGISTISGGIEATKGLEVVCSELETASP